MSSILSRINFVSRFLNLLYGDYWLKRQGAIIFRTIIPFVFFGFLYLWYRSLRNAFIVLNLWILPTKPWGFIVEWSYFLLLVLVAVGIFFVLDLLQCIFEIRSNKEMLDELRVEAKKLFEIKEKAEDLSRTMRLSLLKIAVKCAFIYFVRFTRFLLFLIVPFTAMALVGFILGPAIHLEILFWTYGSYQHVTILGVAPFALFETVKEYLFHPFMSIFYFLPFLLLIGFTESISSNIEKRGKRSPLLGLYILVSATNVLYRISRACAVTVRCLIEDVRQTSLEVMILSQRDIHRALLKNIGENRKICIITLNTQILDELGEDEKEELRRFFVKTIPRIFKKGLLSEMTASVVKRQGKRANRELKKTKGHAIFALVKEGCQFYALGRQVFKLSMKYRIWCEDPFVKEKIIAIAGK